MSESTNPPEAKSGMGIYLIGALLLAAGIGLIIFLTNKDEKPKEPVRPALTQTEEGPALIAAPPPPKTNLPPPEPEDAGDDASDAADGDDAAPVASGSSRVSSGTGGGEPTGACSKCGDPGNEVGGPLQSALQGSAGAARGCYNRAINKSGNAAEGKMNVQVNVGSNGSVCGVRPTTDTVGSPEVTNCVLKQFQGKQFPKPTKGCVTVNIPLNFAVKKD